MRHQGGSPRAVGVLRLSRYTDASTSPEVQTDTITQAGASIGAQFIGWARDTDVSALKTTPWEREELRYWLDRPDEWDVMIWQRMDRAVRSMVDMADLGRFAKTHRKRLVFASGPGGGILELDFTSIMSEFMMMFFAFAAQLEGQTIMERNQGAAAYLQQIGRWPGGSVPYGHRPVRRVFPDGNEGWWLAADEDDGQGNGTAPIRRKMVDMAIHGDGQGGIEGATYVKIRDYLEEIDAITPRNHRAALARPPRDPDPDDRWHVETVRKMLMSATTRGHLVKKDGTPVLTVTGEPVLQGEPLIDDQAWCDLQEALKRRDNGSSGVSRRKDAHPLLDVLLCGICGRNVHRHFVVERKGKRKGLRYENFRCTGLFHDPDDDGKRRGLSILADPVLEHVEQWFLGGFGKVRRTEVVTRGGVDNRSAIAELEASIANLGRNLASVTGPAAELLAGQLNGMSQRLAVLQQKPYEPPRKEIVELPGTWGDDWLRADWEGKRAMLLSVGVRIKLGKLNGWRRPVGERLTFEVRHSADPVVKALEAVEGEPAVV